MTRKQKPPASLVRSSAAEYLTFGGQVDRVSQYMRRRRRNAGEQDKASAPSAAVSAQPALGGTGSPFTNQ